LIGQQIVGPDLKMPVPGALTFAEIEIPPIISLTKLPSCQGTFKKRLPKVFVLT
jgi:hypothetical protein